MAKHREVPTIRQFEALKFVYFMDLSLEEAADRMNISKQAVHRLLQRLGEIAPEFKDMVGQKPSTPKKKLSYYITMDYDIEESF